MSDETPQPAPEPSQPEPASALPPETPISPSLGEASEPIADTSTIPIESAPTETITEVMPVTAQTPVNEPLEEPEISQNELMKPTQEDKKSFAIGLLITARNTIQFQKRKKLDKIMALFLQQSKITNDEVEKLLRVSDATATRYLETLEKEGKIKQVGKTGRHIHYEKTN